MESSDYRDRWIKIWFYQSLLAREGDKPDPLEKSKNLIPLTTGVKQAVPYRTGREARYLSVSTE
jgi:hypothetical protein